MNTKKCCSCKEFKDVAEFHKNKKSKDGYSAICKSCAKEYQKNYRDMNRDRIKEYNKSYREEHKEELLVRNRDYYKDNRESRLAYRKRYREMFKSKVAASKKKYYEENKEELKVKRLSKESDATILQKREYNRDYYIHNKQTFLAANAKRKAAKKLATPKWLSDEDLDEIKNYYDIALMFRLYSGEYYHVDHIIPLRGKLVSGLHVPWNLQVIPAKENLRKRNYFNIED